MNRKLFLLSLVAAVFTLAIAGCQREGCTDPKATNYDSDAKKDNGTCVYAKPDSIIPTKEISIDMTLHDVFQGLVNKDTISYYAAQQDVKFVTLNLETDGITTSYRPAHFRRAHDTLQTRFDISPKVMGAGTIIVNARGGAQLPDIEHGIGMALEDSTWFASHGFTVRRDGAVRSR